MITKGSIRRKSVDIFKKVIELRKKGLSYTEIRNETGIAKSTINNWLTFAGLTLSKDHLLIQAKKRIKNHIIGTEASKITRARKKDRNIQEFILEHKKYLDDPFFVAGVMLYQAEGSKSFGNGFSNSDFRLILIYIKFLEKYFSLRKDINFRFRLYIHDIRKSDKDRILNFWSKKLLINQELIRLSWKHNKVTKRRFNLNYVGQFEVRILKYPYFTKKILAISDIILSRYQNK
ncbi:MAG TPA: hypothetical protein VL401_03035 [Alphaproteobacteria bacterium]|jgi:hypothetical protein|nr:hypothetical protein [Alphaproteobacteria bacterium]